MIVLIKLVAVNLAAMVKFLFGPYSSSQFQNNIYFVTKKLNRHHILGLANEDFLIIKLTMPTDNISSIRVNRSNDEKQPQ